MEMSEVVAIASSEEERVLSDIVVTGVAPSWDVLQPMLIQLVKKHSMDYVTNPAASFQPKGPQPSTREGHVEPPFGPRGRSSAVVSKTLSSEMSKEEAETACVAVQQLIEEFADVPFTIRRICELLLQPRNHYRTVGKYLRALERVLFVTSPLSTFDVISEADQPPSMYARLGIEGALKQASTPIFTTIPFLHEDARSRSRSKSPGATHAEGASSLLVSDASGSAGLAGQALGLVDELDNPAPGHLSQHPTALTSVTTVIGDVEPLSADRPVDSSSLETRFTFAKEESPPPPSDTESSIAGESVKAGEDAEVEGLVLEGDSIQKVEQ